MNVSHLSDPNDSRLEVYRQLRQSNLTRWSGTFIAEGLLVVERLLKSGLECQSVLVSERRWEQLRSRLGEAPEILVLPQRLAAALVGYNFHAGVLACGHRPRCRNVREATANLPNQGLFLAAPHVTSPDNLGQLIRLSAAFGVQALLLGAGSADPFSRRAVRVSMGSGFQLPVIESRNLEADLVELRRRHGVVLFASTLAPGATPLRETVRPKRAAILVGNEAVGLGPAWEALCDVRVTIPMSGDTDSLNVAAATAVLLYHFSQVARLE